MVVEHENEHNKHNKKNKPRGRGCVRVCVCVCVCACVHARFDSRPPGPTRRLPFGIVLSSFSIFPVTTFRMFSGSVILWFVLDLGPQVASQSQRCGTPFSTFFQYLFDLVPKGCHWRFLCTFIRHGWMNEPYVFIWIINTSINNYIKYQLMNISNKYTRKYK